MGFWQLVGAFIVAWIFMLAGGALLGLTLIWAMLPNPQPLDIQGRNERPSYPDLDFCSKCREHTDFEFDEENEEWLSICCGAREVQYD